MGSYADAGYYGKVDIGNEVIELTAISSPLKKLLIVMFVALLWNGIISMFVVDAVKGFMRGNPDWYLTVIMVPFVLIGLLFIVGVFHGFLGLFNPRVKLKLRPGSIQLGEGAEIQWEIFGKVERIWQFSIKLSGREEATYRRGTDTHTDKETFYEMELFSTSSTVQTQYGEIGFAIPSDTMHTFKADNNKVIWSLEVHGDINRWPDVKEEFEINIVPGGAG